MIGCFTFECGLKMTWILVNLHGAFLLTKKLESREKGIKYFYYRGASPTTHYVKLGQKLRRDQWYKHRLIAFRYLVAPKGAVFVGWVKLTQGYSDLGLSRAASRTCFLVLALMCLPVVSFTKRRSSVVFTFFSALRLSGWGSATKLDVWGMVEILTTFFCWLLLHSLQPKQAFLLCVSSLLALLSPQLFLSLFYKEKMCCCIPVVYLPLEVPSKVIVFLLNTWKLRITGICISFSSAEWNICWTFPTIFIF